MPQMRRLFREQCGTMAQLLAQQADQALLKFIESLGALTQLHARMHQIEPALQPDVAIILRGQCTPLYGDRKSVV